MYNIHKKSHPKNPFLLKMKFTILFLFIGINIGSALNTYSQTTLLSLHLKDKSLKEIFSEIEKNSEFVFIYEKSMDLNKRVSIEATNENISDILNKLFASTDIQYLIADRQIAISKKSYEPPPTPAQQGIRVSGTVQDDFGEPLPGVSVTVRGMTLGMSTDANGEFMLTVPSDTCVLQFSYIGFKMQEVLVGNRRIIAVSLSEETATLEEVVVVAFGKQKKESLVSAIATISPSELKIPSSNLTTAFAGRMSGVIAFQRSGEPGLDNAEFFIRGITSFSAGGKKDPLILIDGIEMSSSDLARINPDDVSSFSIMKDANAAALYGARGANGVILVSTKEGQADKLTISIRTEVSTSANSELVELADPITFMRLHNEAVKTRNAISNNAKRDRPYSPDKIYYTELGIDPVMYPSVDWYHYLIKDRTFNQRVNTNIVGGGKAVQYYLAANYQHDTGILKETADNKCNNNIDLNRFQIRSNITIKLTPQTTGMVRFYGTFDDAHGPKQGGADIFNMARNATPVQFLPYYPKDESNEFTNHLLFGRNMSSNNTYYSNPLAEIVSGYKESKKSMMLIQLEVNHSFDGKLKGLFARGMVNLKRDAYYDLTRSYSPFYYTPESTTDGSYRLYCYNPLGGTEYLNYDFGSKSVMSSMYAEGRIGYGTVLAEKHNLDALLVGTLRTETNTEVTTIQQSLPSRNVTIAGRLAYGFDSRYFIEGNFGLNGSERFSKQYRFGFFPSIGAGWMVSNESFMEDALSTLSKLKLKATYGLVGNDQIGYISDRFFYLSQVDMNAAGYVFGTDRTNSIPGVSIVRYANELVTWEIARKLNLGIEFSLFKDLDVLADFFTERRENILQTRQDIPSTMGLVTIPQANVGIAQGKGFETEIKYQKNFTSDLWLVVNGNFTYATAKYVQFEEAKYPDAPWLSNVGQKLSQPRGLIAERLFIDEDEVKNSPRQTFGEYGAGDIKYRDINDDGQINSDDMVPIGYPSTPEIIYGTGLSLGVKGFDISCFFQGSVRSSFYISPAAITPFINDGQRALMKYIADDHWSEDNRNLHAFWPRLSDYNINNNSQNSTYWQRNGAFLRLKTAEIGYTLSEKISRKAGLSMLRFYASGINLFVWSKFKMWDPEMAGNGLGYPIQRVYNLGLNINF